MTKQEEIREGIRAVLRQMNTEVMLESGRDYSCYVDKILNNLHSQGCVIKVDNKVPAEGLYLSGDFKRPNWLRKMEVEAIMDLATEPLVVHNKSIKQGAL